MVGEGRIAAPEPKAGRTLHDAASMRNLGQEETRRAANLQDTSGAREGVGQAIALPSPVLASATPVLRALMEAVVVGVQNGDVASAQAAARALVAFLNGIAASDAADTVIEIAERRATYRIRPPAA